jgi:NADPH-dependent curcumin reductase CurA
MPRAAEAISNRRARRVGAGGKVKTKVDTQHGLENASETLWRLFEGRNEGK